MFSFRSLAILENKKFFFLRKKEGHYVKKEIFRRHKFSNKRMTTSKKPELFITQRSFQIFQGID